MKPEPVMATEVPPEEGPVPGLRLVTTGTNENTSPAVFALVPPAAVTVTSTAPVPAGAVAVMEVAELTV